MSAAADVVDYYDRKTDAILRKYGPGPRVHFHGGLIESNTVPAASAEGLRQQLVQSQEALLCEAARSWDAERHLSGAILDCGCGLGGGSIFWAQEYGARVFALTNVPRHTELIAHFAAEAGVVDRVVPILGDACAIPEALVFGATVAIDSSSYLDREAWFRHLSLRMQGSRVFICDIFAQREDCRARIDRYYGTYIGSVDEYAHAAKEAGFELDETLDLTARSSRFWEFSIIYSQRLLESNRVTGEEERHRLRRSIDEHGWCLQEWTSGGLAYALLSFVRL